MFDAWRRSRRHPGLKPPWARLTLAFAALLIVGGALIWNAAAEARLVRSDPDGAAAAGLSDFASARGGRLYQGHCRSCHGSAGLGDRARGTPDLTDQDWLYGQGRVSDIERVIRYGIRAPSPKAWSSTEMPAYARPIPYPREPTMRPLKPSEIRDVAAFLRRVEGQSADSTAAARGGEIYHGRGGCYDCHADDAGGDSAIGAPNLSDRILLYGDNSAAALFDSIAYGRAGMCPAWNGKLSAAQTRELALYVHRLARSGALLKGGDAHDR